MGRAYGKQVPPPQPHPLIPPYWAVDVTADGVQVRIAHVATREEAAAIAALLAQELGIPTWVPALPGGAT